MPCRSDPETTVFRWTSSKTRESWAAGNTLPVTSCHGAWFSLGGPGLNGVSSTGLVRFSKSTLSELTKKSSSTVYRSVGCSSVFGVTPAPTCSPRRVPSASPSLQGIGLGCATRCDTAPVRQMLAGARTPAATQLGSISSSTPLGVSQHPDQCRSERPVLLAVDQELGVTRPVAVRRGVPMRPVADQLLVRTGEMARKQGVGLDPLGNVGAVARYLPALSGMRLL